MGRLFNGRFWMDGRFWTLAAGAMVVLWFMAVSMELDVAAAAILHLMKGAGLGVMLIALHGLSGLIDDRGTDDAPGEPAPVPIVEHPSARLSHRDVLQRVVHLIDQPQCKFRVAFFSGRMRQAEKVAHCEGVRPQVAPRWALGCKPGALREVRHERNGFFRSRIRHVSIPCLRACHR